MRSAAKNGNAEAQALLDEITKKFGSDAATEEDIADAFEAFALNHAQIADEEGIWERFVNFVKQLFGEAEKAASERRASDARVNEFFQMALSGYVDEAVAQDEARSEQGATHDDAVANDETQRSSIRRAKRISMTPQETAKFIAEFRETEARFFKREMEPLPWGALHTGDYGYLYDRFSDGTFDIRNRWRIGSKDDNVYWQTRKDFNDAIDATPETAHSDFEVLRGDGRGHSRNDTDWLGDGRAAMDDARLAEQSIRQGGEVPGNGESPQRPREDIGRDAFAGRDSAGRDSAGGVERKSSITSRVPAEEDAAYMDAVKRGDMETAQRMVREAAELKGLFSQPWEVRWMVTKIPRILDRGKWKP